MRPAETVIPAAPSVPEQPVPAVAARAATTVLPTAQPRRRPAIPAVLVGVFRLPPRRVERAVAVLDERVLRMQRRVDELAAQLRDGAITFDEWRGQMAEFRSDAVSSKA